MTCRIEIFILSFKLFRNTFYFRYPRTEPVREKDDKVARIKETKAYMYI